MRKNKNKMEIKAESSQVASDINSFGSNEYVAVRLSLEGGPAKVYAAKNMWFNKGLRFGLHLPPLNQWRTQLDAERKSRSLVKGWSICRNYEILYSRGNFVKIEKLS